MVAREVYMHEMKKFKEMEVEHKDCASKIRAAEELSSRNVKAKNDVQSELDDFSSKFQYLEHDMRNEAQKVVYQQIIRTRLDMMLEYHRVEWSSWDEAEMVGIYNEAYPDDAFPLDDLYENDAEMNSPKGSAQDDE